MTRSKSLTIAVVVALVGMAAIPMAASAATGLSVDVDQRPETGDAVVTVTENDTAVENATVEVTSSTPYAGNGTYETDANGTVVLPNPNETASVQIDASANGTNASSDVELVPLADSLDVTATQATDGTATVTVTQYGDAIENATVNVSSEAAYDGNGTYTTDADGAVTLPNPNETVSVQIDIRTNGVTAATEIELTPVEESLDVTTEQASDGAATVTVTQYDDPVANATVDVDAERNYSGTGTYTTDANGTVVLDQPEDTQNVTVTATANNLSAEATTELTGYAQLEVAAEQNDDGVLVTVTDGDDAVSNATVAIEADGDYPGTGTYTTDDAGEVALPLPQENVTITVTATADNETATTTTQLTVEFVEQGPFGQAVAQFVGALQSAGFDGPPGQAISDFVTQNNPGNADDAPGNSGEAPGNSDDDADDENETADDEGDDDAPGRSGDAQSNSEARGNNAEDGPGRSDEAPGQSGDAPGRSEDDDENETDDDENESAPRGNPGNGNAADDRDEADDDAEEDDSDGANETDDETEADDAEEADDDGEEDDSDDSDDDAEDDGEEDDSAPGNSGNAPGRN
ncbi:hypothetical protein [Halobellus inordinatus]|uniref:hypothetical protein n=1 Tax=Halobellus inordinatus TaxID=1126236 RepID=UPI00210B14AA|nr:hypothetical protein [Halobellus inordinatus]